MDLSMIPARSLDKFIEDYLLPDTQFRLQVKRAIHTITSFLKERCFRDSLQHVRVSKVVKGGSSGKGTTLRDRSDADLVVFISPLTSFQEQFEHRGEYIEEIRRQLIVCQREKGFGFSVECEIQTPNFERPRALSFTISSAFGFESVEFDVLPAFDALGQWSRGKPNPDIYVKLIRECESADLEGEFSPCFTELQKDFLKQRPTKVKSLIRLVKYWYQKCKENLGKPLPQKYALELLAVHAWERGSGQTEFSTTQGFRTVLELVLNYQQLRIYWTKYYDFQNPVIRRYLEKQLHRPRPVILDPADPTGNVAGKDRSAWRRLAQEAKAWLSYPCFWRYDGPAVQPWSVQPVVNNEDEDYNPIGYYARYPTVLSTHQGASFSCEHAAQENDGWTCSIL